ncbi:MAG: glutamine--fructose-6-phosphate transaminase (isomerizing), partial [Bdellovibrionales bacterium]|nr:glutamine--fructose-6-phosphate transaminase (isomerizing) [Bdellovibrionales bacterium]
DSAGIAVYEDGEVFVSRAMGKLQALKDQLSTSEKGKRGTIGIGHTRWATHGKPSETNAHPHSVGRVSLIHNGIIENYVELREALKREGVTFSSETDTEIAAHLLSRKFEEVSDPFLALKEICTKLRGSYAFLAIDREHPDRILVAKNATPIVIGIGEGEVFVASDIPAVLPFTREVIVLEDGDLAEVSLEKITIENGGESITRPVEKIAWDPVTAQKGGFKHYMLKEVHEQPQVIGETFRGRLNIERSTIHFEDFELDESTVRDIDRIVFAACGTAWHACLVTKFLIENLSRIPCDVDYASEFRYRTPVLSKKSLFGVVSQSGETADTLAALELAKNYCPTFAVCNVLGSSIARKADHVFFTHAGPEISVASTKAFTTQLTGALLFAVHLGQKRGTVTQEVERGIADGLIALPTAIREALELEGQVQEVARAFHTAKDFLYLGRGICYPVALEGALKLKEISYIHAEGYPAGEMKHGPIALIDRDMPVVIVLQRADQQFEKTLSNLREVQSREGRVIAVTDSERIAELEEVCEEIIQVPYLHDYLSPILLTIPLQLLAYYIAVLNGTDVDLPRNLAKSVTVE